MIKEFYDHIGERVWFYEYQISKSILMWLVAIKILTINEARLVDALNRVDFNIDKDTESLYNYL
jgi:hypothetical protein